MGVLAYVLCLSHGRVPRSVNDRYDLLCTGASRVDCHVAYINFMREREP